MANQETYTPPKTDTLWRVRRARRAEEREACKEFDRERAEDRKQAASTLLAKLATANEVAVSLQSQFEIVSPVSRLGRLARIGARTSMIPAITSHYVEKLDFVNYPYLKKKTTGHYLHVEPVTGYNLGRSETNSAVRVLTVDGRVGRLLDMRGYGIYPTGGGPRRDEMVDLLNDENRFDRRQTDGVWGHSVRPVRANYEQTILELTEQLDNLLLNQEAQA